MRTLGLSIQSNGPVTVKLVKCKGYGNSWKIVNFTVAGTLLCIDSLNVRMCKSL